MSLLEILLISMLSSPFVCWLVGFTSTVIQRFNPITLQVYGYGLYQYRITMIRRRDPGHFG